MRNKALEVSTESDLSDFDEEHKDSVIELSGSALNLTTSYDR